MKPLQAAHDQLTATLGVAGRDGQGAYLAVLSAVEGVVGAKMSGDTLGYTVVARKR